MFGWELMNILQNDPAIRRNLINVDAIDKDWTPPTRLPACYVINTDNSDGSGQHWVSFFIDTDCRVLTIGTRMGHPHCNRFIYSWLLRQGCHPIRYNRKNDTGIHLTDPWGLLRLFFAHASHGRPIRNDFGHIP